MLACQDRAKYGDRPLSGIMLAGSKSRASREAEALRPQMLARRGQLVELVAVFSGYIRVQVSRDGAARDRDSRLGAVDCPSRRRP